MLSKSSVQMFAEKLRGESIQPGDKGFDEARALWNGMIDRKPALIARCLSADDVINSVNFARENALPLSIKGGGHGVAGKSVCDDGLMIDLSLMNAVVVDSKARTVRVEPGAMIGDVDRETQVFGLATPVGIVSETGIAGLTLGGGFGYLGRKHGLTIDNLISADLVTADGRTVHASEDDNPDLFWALRGGGGNFGVVTSFEFRLHEVGPEVMTAQVFYPIEDAGDVLRFYRNLTADAPDELACYAFAVRVPSVAPFPESFQGKTAIALVACHSGTIDDGKTALAPLHGFGTPILSAIQTMPFAALQKSFDNGMPDGKRYYWKAHYFKELTDEAIDVFASHTSHLPGPLSIVGFEPLGGAISRVDESETAFPQRQAAFALGIWSGWEDPADDEEIINWTRELHVKMTPFAIGGVYSNYLDQDDDDQVKAAFGANYERLQRVKATYDPENLFRLNQNIQPKT